MNKKIEVPNPNEITRIERNRFGEEEEVTYKLGPVLRRVKIEKKEKKEKKNES